MLRREQPELPKEMVFSPRVTFHPGMTIQAELIRYDVTVHLLFEFERASCIFYRDQEVRNMMTWKNLQEVYWSRAPRIPTYSFYHEEEWRTYELRMLDIFKKLTKVSLPDVPEGENRCKAGGKEPGRWIW
jgi:hypothetical protein